MEDRLARFIGALRAAGVRVSIAESEDAWRAVRQMGVLNRDIYRWTLRATLVKNAPGIPTFDELFPLYFGLDEPRMSNPLAEMTPEQREMLQQALAQLVQNIRQILGALRNSPKPSHEQLRQMIQQPGMPATETLSEFRDLLQHLRALQRLLEALLHGKGLTQEELQDLADRGGMPFADSPSQAQRVARQMQRLLGWEQLDKLLDALMEILAQQGMDPASIRELRAAIERNKEALRQQMNRFAGQGITERLSEELREKRQAISDLLERPFEYLTQREVEVLHDEVRRLAARLRSRVSLRQKRGKEGRLDPKGTLRANLRYGGVPLELRFKSRRRKPKLVTLLDMSTSMRPVTRFFLALLYQLQDQVQKTRSFAFIDHLQEVSADLASAPPEQAISVILEKLPLGSYNTDLGYSLQQFEAGYSDAVDSRTTFIVLGDARNNDNDPALDVLALIRRRCRRLIWLNPEYPAQWGTGDSDMLRYAPLCTEVYQVRNLAQLAEAVDRMLAE